MGGPTWDICCRRNVIVGEFCRSQSRCDSHLLQSDSSFVKSRASRYLLLSEGDSWPERALKKVDQVYMLVSTEADELMGFGVSEVESAIEAVCALRASN
jgi:hypothetical protein